MIDPYHRFYLWAQKRQSWAKRAKDPSFRTLRYLSEIRDWMPGLWPWPEPVLCLGPRNELELGYLRKAGMDGWTSSLALTSSPSIQTSWWETCTP